MNDKTTLDGNQQTLLNEAIEALSVCMIMPDKSEAWTKFISTLDQLHNLQEAYINGALCLGTSSSSVLQFGLVGKLARQVLNYLLTPSHQKNTVNFSHRQLSVPSPALLQFTPKMPP